MHTIPSPASTAAIRRLLADAHARELRLLDAASHLQRSVAKYSPGGPLSEEIIEGARKRLDQIREHVRTLDAAEDSGHAPPAHASASIAAREPPTPPAREPGVSPLLADVYAALNRAAMTYTRLHTAGLALRDPLTAELALNHLKTITPQIMAASQHMPLIVAHDLARECGKLMPDAARLALQATQAAWHNEVQPSAR